MRTEDPNLGLGTVTLPTGGGMMTALLIEGCIHPVGSILEAAGLSLGGAPAMLDVMEEWPTVWPILRAFAETSGARSGIDRADIAVHAPIQPRQIICAGANYRRHVIELMTDHAGAGGDMPPEERRRYAERLMDHRATHGQPFAFLKPVSAILDPFGELQVPPDAHECDWELELAAVIGRTAHRVTRDEALEYVAGYTIANDISARDRLARIDFPSLGFDWLAGKGGPGFLPLGPWIVPAERIENPQALQVTLDLNGQTMQDESTADMIFDVARLIEYITTYVRLMPGDVICTGSPAGNGTHYQRFLRSGDIITGSISGLGAQRISCSAEALGPRVAVHRPFEALTELSS